MSSHVEGYNSNCVVQYQGWRHALIMRNENDLALTITELLNPIRISVQYTEETIPFLLTPFCKLLMNSLNVVGCWCMCVR